MTAYYNEIEPYPAEWLRNLAFAGHIAAGHVDNRSIKDVVPRDLDGFIQCHFFAGVGVWSYALRLAGWPDSVPVWTGSCPCQPFSSAGKGAGFSDERHLWPEWFRLIRECRPPVVFGEQVASPAGLAWLDSVFADLEGAGYACGAADLGAAGVGAPHIRQRLFFVAYAECGPTKRHGFKVDAETGTVPSKTQEQRIWSNARDGGPVGGVGQLADTNGAGLERARPAQPEERRGDSQLAGASTACRGFWQGAEWIPCKDGKWRPVEPGSFPLVDGAAQRVVRLCTSCSGEKGPLNVEMPKLLKIFGRDEGRVSPQVLLHGLFVETQDQTANQWQHGKAAGAENGGGEGMRGVRVRSACSAPPQRQEPSKQRPIQPSSALFDLSSQGARESCSNVNLRSLREAIRGGQSPQSKQDLQCFVCGRMEPKVRAKAVEQSRHGRLRAYGNAIVAEVAAAFIRAAMSALQAEVRP